MSDFGGQVHAKRRAPKKSSGRTIMMSDYLEIAILMCAPKLGGALKKYTETRVQLIGSHGFVSTKKRRERASGREETN